MANQAVADVKMSISRGALHLQRVPREMFDLIPGEAREVAGRNGTFVVKEMSLAVPGGKHMLMLAYCDEATTGFPPEARGNDSEPLLRDHQPQNTGMDAPAG